MIPFLAALTGSRKVLAIVAVLAACAAIAYAGHSVVKWRNAYVKLPQVELELKACEAAVATFKQAVEAANERVRKLNADGDADRRALAEAKARQEEADRKVSRLWGRIRALEETTDETTGCPVIRISTGYGVCFAAAAAGDAADVAACEAAGGDGSVPSGPGS